MRRQRWISGQRRLFDPSPFDERLLMLYVFRWPDDAGEYGGLIKIGKSRDVERRWFEHFWDADLVAFCPTTDEEEANIHDRLRIYQAPHFPKSRSGWTEVYYPYRAVEAVVRDIEDRCLGYLQDAEWMTGTDDPGGS